MAVIAYLDDLPQGFDLGCLVLPALGYFIRPYERSYDIATFVAVNRLFHHVDVLDGPLVLFSVDVYKDRVSCGRHRTTFPHDDRPRDGYTASIKIVFKFGDNSHLRFTLLASLRLEVFTAADHYPDWKIHSTEIDDFHDWFLVMGAADQTPIISSSAQDLT